MRKFLRFVVVLALLVAGGLYALTFVDLGRFKPQIEAAAQDATGRTLKIEGPLNIGFSLVPTVVTEKISFQNADWGTRPQMVTAEKLRLQLALLPLLTGNVDVREVTLEGADVYLETDRRGRGNWEFGEAGAQPAADESAGGGMSLAGVPQIEIRNLAIAYRDGQTGKVSDGSFEEVSLLDRAGGFHVVVEGIVTGSKVSFSADVEGDMQQATLSDASLTVAGTSIGGDLALDMRNRPKLTGALSGTAFDVTPFLSGGGEGKGGPVFSRDPLPLDALTVADADIDLTLGELRYGKVSLTSLKLPLKLTGGKLAAPLTAEYRGSPVKLAINADGGANRVNVDVNAANFDIGKLLADLDVSTMLNARADFGAKLAGGGKSMHAIASSLSGQTNLVIGKGTINSRALAIVSDDLVNVLIPNGESGETAQLTCAISRFDFQGGVGKATALALETNTLLTTGSGTVDLGKERVDLLFKPKPKKASLVSLAFPVRLSGPLTSPTAGLDRTGVVTGVATAVAGTALTGGIGALLPLMSTGSSVVSGGDCAAAAAAAKESSGGITGTIGGAAEGAAKGAGDVLEGIGKGLGGIFGN
ncbi:AsmA family protein [Parvibaculum lavamentivorans DS-1]|uniref:AsmA family protein n=1 Tax=Parvibaculum lavamentivorans (strain DS-1 / DSM 13023 / NCIMB 13966) TaxID=402881 RepID=A7HWU4_PARL1|nr:AsmA family protein [Parvibaculum lavamentivorans]ABS64377.1 AsmA family protein [Parvibaculum lavamentivorans DS-1]